VAQVTCEIGFTSDSEDKLHAAELYPLFWDEFTDLQAVPVTMNVQVLFAQQGVIPQQPPQNAHISAFRFATDDGKRFVQLSKTNFVYQSNEQYPGWESFRAKLIDLWNLCAPKVKPALVTKIGLRYINRIAKSETQLSVSDWLQPTADIPEALVASKEHFMGRIETSPQPSHLRLITVAAEQPGPDWPLGSIIMDIDRISADQFEPVTSEVVEKLDFLHEDVWKSFSSAATIALKDRMSKALKK
jgi:uncharacterized protein (TIGR04255 family)